MVRHVVTAGIAMLPGLAAVAFVRWRYGEGERTLGRFALAFVVLLVVVAAVSAMSEVTVTRCPDDPLEICEYNDSTPAIATIAVVYSLAGLVRGWMLYAEK